MSSREEGDSQNRTATETKAIERCHELLKLGDFLGARSIVDMNQSESSKHHDLFEQARAICDVLIASENRIPNGLMDCYGMIRVNQLGQVSSEDFEKLMKLLEKRHNHFPFCQEAADKALLAWSLLSKPLIKALYDLVISANNNRETQENGRDVGGSQSGDGEVVVVSDDDDDGYEGQEISMARTSRLVRINGIRMKVIPILKKQKKK